MAKNLPYSAVAQNNRKEFDVMIKWNLDKNPNGGMAQMFGQFTEEVRRDERRKQRSSLTQSLPPAAAAQLTTHHHDEGEQHSHAENVSTAPELKRAHVRRKHRGNCPKHLMREIERSGGVAAPLTPTCNKEQTGRSESAPLPKLPVPNMIGRGLGEFLAGVRNPHYDRVSYVHRPTVDHPDFTALDRTFDATVGREAPSYDPKKTHKPAPGWLLDDKLLHDGPPDRKHYRQKYEMKAHMEAVRMMGKALLREFSGAAFK